MIHKRAAEAAKEMLTSLKLKEPPIDVRAIVQSLDILISEAPNDDQNMSGLILRSKGMTLIGVNSDHSENRKRFTIAHELGHYKLHDKGVFVDPEQNFSIMYRRKTDGYDPEESEANAFAAELLMPEDWVSGDFTNLINTFKESFGKVESSHFEFIVASLAEKFAVSGDAMRIRLDNLALAC
jgi:Zn-dependent peptidase ImmA (M78 family)